MGVRYEIHRGAASVSYSLAYGRVWWRWLLLCIPVAVWVTLWFVPERPPLLPALVILGAAALALLLYRLDSTTPETLPAWLALSIFLALYFVRLTLLLDDPVRLDQTFPEIISSYFHTGRTDLGMAFAETMLVFVPFCLAATATLSLLGARQHMTFVSTRQLGAPYLYVAYVFGVFLLMVVSGYVAYKYRIGQMGVDPGVPLPFRLKGVVFYGRTVVLPLLILSIIYLGHAADKRSLVLFGFGLLLLHGVSDMALRGSRSSLLLIVLLAAFLVGSGGLRLKRLTILALGVILAIAIWLFPIVMNYRALRIVSDAGGLALFFQALESARSDVISSLIENLAVIYYRIPGIETIWSIIGFNGEPLNYTAIQEMRTPLGVTGHLNFGVYKLSPDTLTLYAPGFVGWLFLVGGQVFLMFGGVLLGVLCVLVPRLIYQSRLHSKPIASTFFLWLLFISMTDATIDGNVLMLATGVVGLILVEIVLRKVSIDLRTGRG